MRQRVRLDVGELAAAVRLDHDAADCARDQRRQRADHVHVLTGVGEVGAVAAVDAAAV